MDQGRTHSGHHRLDMAMQAEIISFDKVGRSFAQKNGELVATRDISVRIPEGEIVTIVGPSGCGKTTMLNLVAGLLKPSTGTVLYRGAPITAINGRTGYMTQSDHLLPWRDVASNIALLLDEPFAALDAQLRVRMQTELFSLSRRLKKTVLFVTHDLDEAVALGDRCLVFSARPGTILKDVQIPLPRDRNILELRRDPLYQRVCAELWDFIAPAIEHRAQ